MKFNADFEKQLSKITPSEQEVLNVDPLHLIDRIQQCTEHCKQALLMRRAQYTIENKLAAESNLDINPIDNPIEWADLPHFKSFKMDYKSIELLFGKWSHNFNKTLRERIKTCETIKTPQKKAETKKLNLVFLFWSKSWRLLELYLTDDILGMRVRLNSILQELQSIKSAINSTKVADYEIPDLTFLPKDGKHGN